MFIGRLVTEECFRRRALLSQSSSDFQNGADSQASNDGCENTDYEGDFEHVNEIGHSTCFVENHDRAATPNFHMTQLRPHDISHDFKELTLNNSQPMILHINLDLFSLVTRIRPRVYYLFSRLELTCFFLFGMHFLLNLHKELKSISKTSFRFYTTFELYRVDTRNWSLPLSFSWPALQFETKTRLILFYAWLT